jgi:molybdate transport system substrate-binding protein
MQVRTPFKASLILAVSLSLPLCAAKVANAAEINVLSGRGFSPVLDAVVGDFEQKTGHTVKISYGPGNKIGERVRADEPADLVIVPFPIVSELVKQGKIREGSTVNIARSDVSMGVRAGTVKPNINSLDAFKQWLLATKSIVCSDPAIGATTSAYFTRMLDRLGIADQMKPKIRFVTDAHTADYVARGEADVAVQLGNELLTVSGIEIIPLPAEFQTNDFVFAAGIATAAKQPEAAKAFIQYLTSPAGVAVIKAKHLEAG